MSFHVAIKDAFEKITVDRVHPQSIYISLNCTKCGKMENGFSVWQKQLNLKLPGIEPRYPIAISKILILIFHNLFHCQNKSRFKTVVFWLEVFWVDKSNKAVCSKQSEILIPHTFQLC